ncbi:uncharacterized protein LOC118512516 isoform X2 [Anopheles stephensi]|uniref:uncharacterized protein LOC118512516 isoform X2 n=1 Tax=Anopheles stephensi TaxID=30069 RepID=UPI0016588906|nr:uncharacterized protein LOC118512516 isoform X2 [Anopheles stephensi]
MSKDTARTRIPRPDGVSSRIPVPGSFRIPNSTVRLPTKRAPAAAHPPATPISFLRPPSQSRSGAISIARSYSGDKLFNGEPSPFPLLTASTPAPAQLRLGLTAPKASGVPFLKKLELVASGTTECLEDIKLCQREFAIPSDDDDDDGVEDGEVTQCRPDAAVQMLVDESLELVGANSTDNLLDPPTTAVACSEENATVIIANKHAPGYARNEHTVTLQRDGNVTYEIRRSGTFVKSSRESLSSPQDRPRPPVLSQTHTRSHTSLSSNVGCVMSLTKTFRRESTESIDSPVLDLTRSLPFRRPSTWELLIDEDGGRRPPILNSTMVNERLLNVTQSIPNITQELLYADVGHDRCLAPGDSVLNRTHSVEDQKQAIASAGRQTPSNRLTFNLEESVDLIQFSSAVGASSKHGQSQVFSSTLHSDSMAIPAAGSVGSGGSVQVKQLPGSQHSTTMLLMDISAQDRTLVPSELELDRDRLSDDEEHVTGGYSIARRNIDQREVSLEADVSAGKEIFDLSLDEPEPCCQDDDDQQQHQQQLQNQAYAQQEVVLRRHLEGRSNTVPAPKQRFSFGLDLTECTLDCSIELCDSSLSLTKPAHLKSPTSSLTKQGSFEMDESLGILTPDQMKEFLDSTTTNTNTNNTNNAANAAGLELQLNTGMGGSGSGAGSGVAHHHHKHGALQHHCRIDQTPSPEELPLDPVGVKTDMSDIMLPAELMLIAGGPQPYGGSAGGGPAHGGAAGGMSELSQADSDPKTDQMTKSATSSKVSNSFITSITSITSLDTGYQGDGEMSRPASRGADHSPSNGPRVKSAIGGGAWQPMMAAAVAAVPRRQDPMTDSDFFTESDADDVFNRGDARRAQIIDGQLYGAPGGAGGIGGAQGANAIFNAIDEQDDQDLQQHQQQNHHQLHQDGGQNEDSCMESSGIFTDVENRADDDLVQRRADDQQKAEAAAEVRRGFDEDRQQTGDDMSPDVSTDTMSSSNSQNFVRAAEQQQQQHTRRDEGDPNATCKLLVLDERENDGARYCDDGSKSNLSQHIGASPKASEHHHYHHQYAIATLTVMKSDGDVGTTGVSTTAGAGSPGSGGSGVVVGSGNVARRCDADSFHDAVSGKRSSACGNGSTNSASGNSGSSGSTSAGRKQHKNEANRGLRKHHASVAEMSAPSLASSRADRLGKVRLFKDTAPSEGSRSGVSSGEQCAGGGDCDQENKRPGAVQGGSGGTRGNGSAGACARGGGPSGSNLSFVKKSNTPNKWDAVMSKIAENKSVMRRNFSDVKSRISCGSGVVSAAGASKGGGAVSTLLRRDSPATTPATGSLKSPPSECTSVASRSSVHGKRTISGSVKRGRTHSKDSEQSSLSDLSLSGGSPKLALKLPSTRPAKKRDVRTINSSSSDLGPPSKTNGAQPARNSAARAAAALQKRISPNVANVSIPLVPEQLKASPPTKRNMLLKRNGTANGTLPAKTPLKDHNRLAGATQTSKSSAAATVTGSNNSPKPLAKSLLRSSTGSGATTASNHHSTTPHLLTHHQHAVSNGSGVATSPTTATSVKAIQRNGTIILDKASSPLLICEATSPVVGEPVKPGTGPEMVNLRNGATSTPEDIGVRQSKVTIPSTCTASSSVLTAGKEPNCDQQRRQHQRENGTGLHANNESVGKGPELVDISLLNHAQKGVEALGVLVQYLVFNLDAFSCPTIKTAHQKTTADLLETKSILDEERTNSQTLKQQLLETTERETELQKLHRCELSRVETCLSEQQRSADDRIAALEAQLLEKESHSRELLSRIDDYEAKLAEHEKQLESSRARELDLLQRINALSCTENELRDKVHSSELAFSERLQAAAMRERDLTEQINGLNRDLERMRRETERKERELEEKLTITKDECVVLRQSRNGPLEPASQNGAVAGGANGTLNLSGGNGGNPLQLNRSSGNINHLQVLQDEVDSLRCVLDLKQREISELRKQTQEYERDAKDLPGALTKISALESRIEDLEVQLKTKTEEEKELQQKLKHLQDNLHQETKIKSRLSLHNEELQWRLKQNSEKFTLAYAELSKSYHENSSFMYATKSSLDQSASAHHHHQLSHNQSRSSCSDRFFDMDDISPPTSPVIKGMVEKSDSVSWVLEIDDEPPEVSASRMVRRAGSFRSSAAYDSVAKRPKCSALNQTANGSLLGERHTAGIQQSSSAASILKQHSSDLSSVKPPPSGSSNSHRLRSKSVSIKAAEPPKKIVRSNSGASASPCPGVAGVPCKPLRMTEMPGSWKEQPLYSSSPYAHKRYLTEDLDLVASGSAKSFAEHQMHRAKDLFLEETELLSEPESPFARCAKLNVEDIANQPIEIFHRDKTPNFKKSKENRGLITCDTTALMAGGSSSAKATGSGLTAREKRREFTRKGNLVGGTIPKEAAGEALVSGSNSDDEALSTSSASSSSCISEASLSSGTGSSNSSHDNSPLHSGKRSSERMNNDDDTVEGGANSSEEQHPSQHRRRHSNISLEDALMKKIVASLNGDNGTDGNNTPMEVSWSEDGDPGSESNV